MDKIEKGEIEKFQKPDLEELKNLLKDPETGGDLLDQIARKHKEDLGLMELVAMHPSVKGQTLFFLYNNTEEGFKARLQEIKSNRDSRDLVLRKSEVQGKKGSKDKKTGLAGEGSIEVEKLSLFGRIQTMSVAEKVQFALKGGKDVRSLLIKDSNRQVAMAVLTSPKITEDEILLLAQSRNVSDELLRAISKNRDWMKNYTILLSLVNNPKTPLPISMPLLPSIKKKDLALLSKSKNIPEGIRSGATRLYAAKSREG